MNEIFSKLLLREGNFTVCCADDFISSGDVSSNVLITGIDGEQTLNKISDKLQKWLPTDFEIQTGHSLSDVKLCDLSCSGAIGFLFVPKCPVEYKLRFDFEDLAAIMKRLRDECPWDKKQTHESLAQYLIEESYEVLDAVLSGVPEKMADELGDVLLQVVFQSRIGQQAGEFDRFDVCTAICKKMMNRHTHIFGEDKFQSPDQVLENWDKIKRAEKNITSIAESMRDIPKASGALMRSAKIQKKARYAGFDWDDWHGAADKVGEELAELIDEIEIGGRVAEEAGDLLFAVVNLARLAGVDPESALASACTKFIARFEMMEEMAKTDGLHFSELNLDVQEAYWRRSKEKLHFCNE